MSRKSAPFLLKVVWLSIFSCFSLFSADAITKETIESLMNENRILSEPIELHITATAFAMVSSTVTITNEDAWLFFDNIRPADVFSTYANYIYIGDNKLANDVNGRIAIYAHGTVIMAHGADYKPLTIYTDENQQGTSKQLEVKTYHNKLGDFDNAIKSFKLKRGYMATFATNADGSGYSRVFIADKSDLIINIMPDELNGTVSFIRVFEHQWVTKKGWCGWNASEVAMIDATCYYDWNVGGTTTLNTEYSVIRQKADWPSWNDINSKQNVTHLAGFNEPDQSNQANMTFQQMIDIWPGMMNSGLRIGSPAFANHWGGNGGNLFDFINKCDELNYRVDFVALHCYWGGKSPINWYNDLKYVHETTGRPLWITEWNNGANWTNEWWPDGSHALSDVNAQKQLNDIMAILQVLDTAHFVERYFIYNWVEDCRAMILNGELTPAGQYYADNNSQIAYNSKNDIVRHWNYITPELTYRYQSVKKNIRLDWVNQNGDLCTEYMIEKKINNGSYAAIYTSTNTDEKFFEDLISQDNSGTVSYRLNFRKADGGSLISNEISFYQTAGKDSIEVGKFQVGNFTWNTSLYSKSYLTEPLVIIGVPTFNNTMPFTKRVAYITTDYFKFRFEPWNYNNNLSLTKKDSISVMCLPAGEYNFGGLKAEVKTIAEVSRDWVPVTFDEEFAQTPVVFSNVVTSNSQYPLALGIRNITTKGFEIRVKTETAITGFVLAEKMNYLAIEPGTGIVDGKRIIVGKSTEGNGITSIPYELEFDATFINPVLFAGLMTDENNNALTLRYSATEQNKIKISNQREMSGSVSVIKEDVLGWMIMDISNDQNTGIIDANRFANGKLSIYPNPSTDEININIEIPVKAEIYNIVGTKIFEGTVCGKIDVSNLHSGIYLLKINNVSGKFIIK